MTLWSHLACLQTPLISSLRAGTQWIGVVNEFAGRRGHAVEVASQVAHLVGDGMTLYKTAEKDEERLREITALIASKTPSLEDPLGILAFGGDRTGNDAVEGVINYLFPERRELLTLSSDRIVERMLSSGIQIGFVRLGGANDNGANYGAPAKKVEEIMSFTDDCKVTSLNMGLAMLGDDDTPLLFCHSLTAGETIATAYEKTAEGRGILALIERGALGLLQILATHKTFVARWSHSDGSTGEEKILEVLVHPSVRAATVMGFPGTPQPGLGTKIFQDRGYGKKLKMFGEVTARGRSSMKGDPSRLLPGERLETLDTPFQPVMEVGQWMEFNFFADGKPYQTAVTANGDFLRRTSGVRVFALPPWPRFMVKEGSLMANLHNQLNAFPR